MRLPHECGFQLAETRRETKTPADDNDAGPIPACGISYCPRRFAKSSFETARAGLLLQHHVLDPAICQADHLFSFSCSCTLGKSFRGITAALEVKIHQNPAAGCFALWLMLTPASSPDAPLRQRQGAR